MKSLIKNVIDYAVKNPHLWTVLDATVIRAAKHAEWERERSRDRPIIEAAIRAISPDLTVRQGVFEGMKYPEAKSIGSMLAPKLLGSYEKEIEPALERICSEEYTEIVDIGCAEGYYAVGLAMRIQAARIFAYDTSQEAIRLCKEMARLNSVSDRLVTGSFCDAAALRSIPFTKKALIISDCEGYEKELFVQESASILALHDLLIEVHDYVDIEISKRIRDLFAATHEIEVYQSIGDTKKAQEYAYDELEAFDLKTRAVILAEGRPATMEWFYMKSRYPHVSISDNIRPDRESAPCHHSGRV